MLCRLAALTTLLTIVHVVFLAYHRHGKQLNNPAVALPVSVMLWRDLFAGFIVPVLPRHEKEVAVRSLWDSPREAEAQGCRYEPRRAS